MDAVLLLLFFYDQALKFIIVIGYDEGRYDLGVTALWEIALTVYNKYLTPHLKENGSISFTWYVHYTF